MNEVEKRETRESASHWLVYLLRVALRDPNKFLSTVRDIRYRSEQEKKEKDEFNQVAQVLKEVLEIYARNCRIFLSRVDIYTKHNTGIIVSGICSDPRFNLDYNI